MHQQTLAQSKKRIEALEQKAIDLADFVEDLQNQTRMQSETEIEALGQKARDLAISVETVRAEALLQSDNEIATLGQEARNLAVSVEAVRETTLLQSDSEIAALGQQAREARAANKQKDEFLAMLGHELRNPLAPIRTAAHILHDALTGYGLRSDQQRALASGFDMHLKKPIDPSALIKLIGSLSVSVACNNAARVRNRGGEL